LIRAGEVSGTLDESLKRIASQEEKDDKMLGSIRNAMVMPVITLIVIFAVFLYMMLEVVPQVEGLYHDLGEELPILTKIFVGIKDFILHFAIKNNSVLHLQLSPYIKLKSLSEVSGPLPS
jgi:type II secretory pathway component PulF